MKTNQNLFRGKYVRLSSFRPEDARIMASWTEDEGYLRNVDSDMAVPASEESLRKFVGKSPNGVEFLLRTLDDDTLIGFVALHSIEWNNQCGLLAIGIGEENYRGKGYGTDALRLILRYGFHELNLHRIGLDVISYNKRAMHVYEKVGFRIEGKMREAVLRDGQKYHRVLMSILRNES